MVVDYCVIACEHAWEYVEGCMCCNFKRSFIGVDLPEQQYIFVKILVD